MLMWKSFHVDDQEPSSCNLSSRSNKIRTCYSGRITYFIISSSLVNILGYSLISDSGSTIPNQYISSFLVAYHDIMISGVMYPSNPASIDEIDTTAASFATITINCSSQKFDGCISKSMSISLLLGLDVPMDDAGGVEEN